MKEIEVYRWDSLIHRYIIEKIRRGYEVSCTPEEIKDFLNFISYFVNVDDDSKDYNDILNNYLNEPRSLAKDKKWSIREEKFIYQSMVKQTDSGLIIPTYDLVYNPYEYEKIFTDELNMYFTKYIERNCSKRQVPTTILTDEEVIKFGENVASSLLMKIWNNTVCYYQEKREWPIQCYDIKKYLLDMDLSKIIGLTAIRENLLDFYFTVSKRIMYLSQNDNEFKMSDLKSQVLAASNFDLITQGYSDLPYHRIGLEDGILIDREKNYFQTIVNFYNGNRKTEMLDDPKVLTLVRNLKDTQR